MIHYTLQGPTFKLEIHEDKIYLLRKPWWKFFSSKKNEVSWHLEGLKQFNITSPKHLFSGRLEWESFDGVKGNLRFTTNGEMVQKIEKYMHKKILKNHEKIKLLTVASVVVGETKSQRKKTKKQRREENLAA